MMSYNSPSSKGEGWPGGVDCMRGLGCRWAGWAALATIAPEAGGEVKKNTGGFPRGEPRTITAAPGRRIAAWRGVPRWKGRRVVLEGGSIDTYGASLRRLRRRRPPID